jgi:3-oxoacyl-[acyl-carrier protein] reductase
MTGGRLDGRVALVTGAGGPMGRAIACRFAAEGASVVLSDISANRLRSAEEACRAALQPGRALHALRADATNRDEAHGVARAALDALGRVDALVNVVGGIRAASLYTPFLQMSEAQWDATMALNLKPGFHLVQALALGMLERAQGAIVNIASVVYAGEGGQADYAAAKAAVASFTRSLAAEFAPAVRVNCIAPGIVATSVLDRLDEAQRRSWIERNVMRRAARPEEIAATAAFLASDESSFITGEVIAVAGGEHPAL